MSTPRGSLTKTALQTLQEHWGVAVGLLFAVVVGTPPMLEYAGTGSALHLNDDMLQEYLSHAILRESLLEYHRFPLWSGYVGGGYPLYAHPHDPSFLAPLWIPVLVLGEVHGVKVNLLLLYLLGVLGAALLARATLRSNLSSAALILLYAHSPFFLQVMGSGNYNEAILYPLPLIAAIYHRGRGSLPWLILAACGMAGLAFFGKRSFPLAMIAIALFACVIAATERRRDRGPLRPSFLRFCWIELRAQVVFVLFVVALAAPKLLPMMDLLEAANVQSHELWPAEREYYTVCGNFLLVFGLCLVLDAIVTRAGRSWRWIFVLVPAAAAWQLYAEHASEASNSYLFEELDEDGHLQCFAELEYEVRVDAYHAVRSDLRPGGLRSEHSLGYLNYKRGVGTVDWYDDWITLITPTQPRYFVHTDEDQAVSECSLPAKDVVSPNPSYRGEAYVLSGAAEVLDFGLEPNRILLTVNANSEATIQVNSNHLDGWSVSHGRVYDRDGLLTLDIEDTGLHDIVLIYRPARFYGSLVLTGIALFSCCVVVAVRRGRLRITRS